MNLRKLENAQSHSQSKNFHFSNSYQFLQYKESVHISQQLSNKYPACKMNEATENISRYPVPFTLATVRLSGVNVFSFTTLASI